MPSGFPPHSQILECRDCGCFNTLPVVASGTSLHCARCGNLLRRPMRSPIDLPLALSLAGVMFYLLAASTPLIALEAAGQESVMELPSGPDQLDLHGAPELAVVVLVTTMLMPLLKLLSLILVLGGLKLGWRSRLLARLFGWVEKMTPWSMIEVFLVAGFVAYTRLGAVGSVELGPAAYALAGLMLVMVALDARLDPEAIWRELERAAPVPRLAVKGAPLLACHTCRLISQAPEGAACPRCGAHLHRRKHNSQARTWALVIAAAVLYIPANAYPVMTFISLGQGAPSTIISGVKELAEAGLWPLAALVFVASLAIPLLKLVGLTVLLVAQAGGSAVRLRDRTRLYRVIAFVGRWSMIDVFLLAYLVALLRLGAIATVEPGAGAVAFASVVVLTMFAAETFDPRVMWDRGAPAHAPPTPTPTPAHAHPQDATPAPAPTNRAVA